MLQLGDFAGRCCNVSGAAPATVSSQFQTNAGNKHSLSSGDWLRSNRTTNHLQSPLVILWHKLRFCEITLCFQKQYSPPSPIWNLCAYHFSFQDSGSLNKAPLSFLYDISFFVFLLTMPLLLADFREPSFLLQTTQANKWKCPVNPKPS